MLEQAMLREQFTDLLARERQAAEAYARILQQTSDPPVREQLQQMLRDKQKHIRLAERLLEIVQ
jgi:rubrerythrin